MKDSETNKHVFTCTEAGATEESSDVSSQLVASRRLCQAIQEYLHGGRRY